VVNIKIAKRDPNAIVPAMQTGGAAGCDLTGIEKFDIAPGECALVDTGLAVEIPQGHAGFILPRSGLALKKGLTVLNAPGLIDSDYRGNLKVLLYNTTKKEQSIFAGDRIAQLVVMKVETVGWQLTGALSDTERGDGGFGSTDEEDNDAKK